MPQNGMLSHVDHRFRANRSFFRETSAKSTGENNSFHSATVLVCEQTNPALRSPDLHEIRKDEADSSENDIAPGGRPLAPIFFLIVRDQEHEGRD